MLASWNDSPAKRAILAFVQQVTGAGPGFVPAAERIATFDNDGTLWVERPMPPQFDFLLRTWAAEARNDPSLASRQPYKAIIEGDTAFFAGGLTQNPDVVSRSSRPFARSWKGTTPEEFDGQVRTFIATAKQPRFGVSYTDLVYWPMLELFEYFKANGFRVFVCSGGGRDFMRVFAEATWGIFKEDVIGSAADYEYIDGKIIRQGRMLGGLALGPGKPAHIDAHTRRLPLLAGGNADVDIEMLESARFALLINHDDQQREYAYTVGAEKSLARAAELGWTVANISTDWSTVF